jgi:hypothetical protein
MRGADWSVRERGEMRRREEVGSVPVRDCAAPTARRVSGGSAWAYVRSMLGGC